MFTDLSTPLLQGPGSVLLGLDYGGLDEDDPLDLTNGVVFDDGFVGRNPLLIALRRRSGSTRMSTGKHPPGSFDVIGDTCGNPTACVLSYSGEPDDRLPASDETTHPTTQLPAHRKIYWQLTPHYRKSQ